MSDLRDRLQSALGSAYEVERELGGGGMSRVCVARETSLGRSVLINALARISDTARAAAMLRTLESKPDTTWTIHISRAYAYLGMGDTARALTEMERGLDSGEIVPILIPLGDRQVDPVRHTARFAAILRRVGLEGRGLTEVAH